jgi:hypothetical protein
MPPSTAGKTLYLNGGDVNPVKIVGHSAAPAQDGSTNRIGSLTACSFTTSSAGGPRDLTADVTVVLGAGAASTWTHFSVYNASDVCLHVAPLNTPRSGLLPGDSIVFKASGADKISISIP